MSSHSDTSQYIIKQFTDETHGFALGAFPIILDEQQRVLLAHRTDYDIWNCPGGGVDHGETPDQTVIREIKEEVCYDAEIVRLAGIYPKADSNELVFSFVCKIVSGTFEPTDEADKIGWFSFEELPRNISVAQIQRLADVLYGPEKIQYAIQEKYHTIALAKEGRLAEVTDKLIRDIVQKKTT